MKGFLHHKKILNTTVLGFFVFLFFLSPVSVSIVFGADDLADKIIDGIWNHSGGALLNMIGYAILSIGSFFIGISGYLLDYSLNELVFGMGEKLGEQNLGFIINNLWEIIRDICNLAFIFGFIYAGFMTILGTSGHDTKKMISSIIIGALLINFSLFFAKAIIDFSNFTAYKIYVAIAPTNSISETITQELGVVSLFNSQGGILDNLFSGISFWFYIFGFILLMTAAFSFLASAILLISRFAALILIMIGAPILFAATVFPKTKSYADNLWKSLIGYSLYAPLYLLLILISTKLMQGILPEKGDGNFSAVLKGGTSIADAGIIELLLIFGICIFFMVSSITLAQKISVAGGGIAINVGNYFRKGAQGYVGRRIVGGASNWGLEKYDRANARNSRAWRYTKRAAAIATLGALDDRTTRGIIESGKKAKFGSDYSHSDDKKYAKERQNRDAQIRPVLTLENARKMQPGAARDAAIERAVRDMSKSQLEEAGFDVVNDPEVMRHISNSAMTDLEKSDEFTEEEKERLSNTRRQVITDLFVRNGRLLTGEFGKASIAQLERLGYTFLMDPNNVHALTDSQIKDIEKSKEFTESEVRSIKNTREQRITQLMSTPFGQTQVFADYTGNQGDSYQGQQLYKSKKAGEIAQLPRAVLMDPAINPHLTAAVLEQIADKKTLNHADRVQIALRLQAQGAQGVAPQTLAYLGSPNSVRNWT